MFSFEYFFSTKEPLYKSTGPLNIIYKWKYDKVVIKIVTFVKVPRNPYKYNLIYTYTTITYRYLLLSDSNFQYIAVYAIKYIIKKNRKNTYFVLHLLFKVKDLFVQIKNLYFTFETKIRTIVFILPVSMKFIELKI